MNRILLIPFTAFVAFLLSVSCKKNNPTNPINKADAVCASCPSHSLEIAYVTDSLDVDTVLVPTSYAQATDFWNNGVNEGIGNFGASTPTGISGAYYEGVSIAFNTSSIMDCPPTRLTFVLARSNYAVANLPPPLMNLQLPGTPIISTTADSLADFLTSYGYTMEKYHLPGIVWFGNSPSQTAAGEIDSIIIRGLEFETFTIGANLYEAELRNICVKHE